MKKLFTIIIVLLFISTTMVGYSKTSTKIPIDNGTTSTPFHIDGNILYVGGSGAGNYSNIQDAIDNASNGDTVFVYNYSSPYYENVVVNKSINLIGEDKSSTIIDGGENGSVVYISADYVTITGFMIKNCGSDIYDAGIYVNSEANTIFGNVLTNNKWYGIYLENSSDNTIYENSITNSNHCGIYLNNSCDGNIIYSNNIINHRSYCIHLSSLSEHNIIYENTIVNDQTGISTVGSFNNIYNNSFEAEANIPLYNSYKNTLTNNTFEQGGILIEGDLLHHWNTHIIENNTANDNPIRYYKNIDGGEATPDISQIILANCSNFTIQNLDLAYSYYFVQLGFSPHNSILNNNIHNGKGGIRLQFSSHNTIAGNVITKNEFGAILLTDSSDNIVTGNTASYNGGGISLFSYWNETSCINNRISDNIVTNSYATGMTLCHANHNIVSGNSITKSVHIGIDVTDSSNNTIINNNISDTTTGFIQAGIYLDWSNNNVIAENIIARNSCGIFIDGNNNIIRGNTIENNSYLGINMFYTCANNSIYHNNFIENMAVNKGENNTWDDSTSMGNYWWLYYDGSDKDGDGIGDTPFGIPGTPNQDRYPLMFPYGEESGVRITRPEGGYLYIRNFKILPFFTTLLLGYIKIKVNAANYIYGIERVEFYVDNIKRRIDSTPPYSWTWRLSSHIRHRHTIKVVAYDNIGNSASDEIKVWRFF